jgi:hypothetical protein
MEKFLKRKFEPEQAAPSNFEPLIHEDNIQNCPNQSRQEIDLENLPYDPGERRRISSYHPNDHDKIRRAYLQRGPYQPRQHNFPQRKIGKLMRRFCPSWFNEFGNWLEYSTKVDAAFAYVVICLDQIMGNKMVVILLLEMDLLIGIRRIGSMYMSADPIVLIIKLGKNAKT